MRSILLLLALAATGCAFFGSLVHGGTVAAGAAAGGALGGPAGAAVGGVAGFYGGDLAAEQLTGTRGVRVDPAGKVQTGGPVVDLPRLPSTSGLMDNPLLIGGIILFIYLGGLGWLRKKINERERANEETNADRVSHKARTTTLETENRRLRKEVDELWDRVTGGPR